MINNKHPPSVHYIICWKKTKAEEMKISREHPHYKMPFEQRLEGGEGGSHVDIQVTVFQAGGKPLPGLGQWENAWCSWTSSGTVPCKWWEWG